MKKKMPLITAIFIYEIIRLCFILSVQAEVFAGAAPLSWYTAVPLLMLPFFLLYAVHKGGAEQPFAADLYVLTKIAGSAGFILFVGRTFMQSKLQQHFAVNEFVLLKMFIAVLLFFTIDVILAVSVMVKNHKRNQTTEGELCK